MKGFVMVILGVLAVYALVKFIQKNEIIDLVAAGFVIVSALTIGLVSMELKRQHG